jgi:diguanylate cyclase (GGDEF)-like protein/PAS domain S-box-containing protein
MLRVVESLVAHDWRLVVPACTLCFFASLVAVNLFHRAQAATGRPRLVWLSLDAAVVGFGTWTTHLIAILAHDPGNAASYDLGLTLLSLLIAASIAGAGLTVALLDLGRWTPALGGAIVGCGVAATHYTGMLMLQLPGRLTWSPELVVASVLLGIVPAALALFVAVTRNDWANALLSASLLTLAIVASLFTGMAAVSFVPDPARINDTVALSPTSHWLVIIGVATAILGMYLVEAWSIRHSQGKLRSEKYLLDAALENMSQGLCMFEADGRIILCNDHYAKLMGVSAATLKGLSLLDVFKLRKASGRLAIDPQEYFHGVLAELRAGRSFTRITEMELGRWVRVTAQPMQGGGWVSTLEDITRWREAQARIAHLARHDALTGLPNRTVFREQLEHALSRTSRNGELVAVHCIDLDNFKVINDSLGHPIGDDLLIDVASRLNTGVRDSDTVARLGGDEFAIVQMGGELQPWDVASMASRIVELLSAPYAIRGHQIVIGTSIGISVAPGDGLDPDLLLKSAELALYRAKEDGRGTYRFFETGMDARAQARRLLELDMRAALLRNEFEVYYQPIYNLETGGIVCLEALLRWNHPLRGMILPADFIPLAEETGLIVPIGDWVLRCACRDAARWSRDVAVAVNLSPAQFKNRNLEPSIISALANSGLAANRLELEITESVFLRDSATTLEIMRRLRDLGIRISMDDFGTGYSSLSYLRSFPFDKIKIDGSFVHELASRDDSMAIVRAVTGLARSLGITTTAEGVETSEQLALLRAEGCNQVQGYLFNPPRPAAEVESMLANGQLHDIR